MPNLSPQAYSSQTLRSTVPEDFDAYQKFINDRPSIDGSEFYGTPGQRLCDRRSWWDVGRRCREG
jgi:hypothetical protein